ncbi:Cyclic AMP-responsive element-binding protein 3-like protein 3 [Halotydeus destructor]|nr:Cyclic AMP-responsive element-binding protein 3-like protein 3 [Halotydeus destructor]
MDAEANMDELGFIASSLGLSGAGGKLFEDELNFNLVDVDEDHLNAASSALATYFSSTTKSTDPWFTEQQDGVAKKHREECSKKRRGTNLPLASDNCLTDYPVSHEVVEVELVNDNDNYGAMSNSSDGEMDLPEYDWIKSSPDVNTDSSSSLSPERSGSIDLLDGHVLIKEEIEVEECDLAMDTLANCGHFLADIKDEHSSIQLHNYTSFGGRSVKSNKSSDKNSKSSNSNGSVSPCSSASSSPNARKSGHGSGRGCRGKPITELNLTEEEKRLLSKEGYADFPSGTIPLTKLEEKILRKVRRKIRNKRSAQCSRQRKKEYVEELEKKYEKCTGDNDCLRRELMKLRKENNSLLLKMKNLISGTGNGQTSMKTSFFVLILSFLLILVPFFRPDSFDDKLMSGLTDPEVTSTGRQLLMVPYSSDMDTGYYNSVNDSNETLLNLTASLF